MNWIQLASGYLVNLDRVQYVVPEQQKRIRFGGPLSELEMEPAYLVFDDKTQVKLRPDEYEDLVRRIRTGAEQLPSSDKKV